MNVTVIPPVVENRPVEVAPAKVQLELSMEEAQFLIAILGRVAYSLDVFRLYNRLYNHVVKGNPAATRVNDALNNTLLGYISPRGQKE